MTRGIYCYIDKKTDKIVYIGKDSYISYNRRHIEHLSPCQYNRQHINKVLQNNPNRYYYQVLLQGNIDEKLLNSFEMVFIRKYNPIFNFTEGGEGVCGWKHTIETKKKLSKLHINKKRQPHLSITKLKMSKVRNTSGYFRVSKQKCKTCKKGFRWRYSYIDKDKKRKDITSVDINKLKEKVISNNLIWRKIR